jgi:hypothetical protein
LRIQFLNINKGDGEVTMYYLPILWFSIVVTDRRTARSARGNVRRLGAWYPLG